MATKQAKAKPVKLFGRESLEAYLSPEQCDLVEEYGAVAMDFALSRDAFITEAKRIVSTLWPKPVAYDTWRPVVSAIRQEIGASPAMSFRAAYKAIHGKLPSKGAGTGEGRKGMSPKRAATGFAARVRELLVTFAAVKTQDIDQGTMRRLATAVEAISKASAALTAAVNE